MHPSALPALYQPFAVAFGPLVRRLQAESDVLLTALGLALGSMAFFLWPTNPPAGFPVFASCIAFISLCISLYLYKLQNASLFLATCLLGALLAILQVENLPPIGYAASAKHGHWVVGQVASIRYKTPILLEANQPLPRQPVRRSIAKPEALASAPKPSRAVVVLTPAHAYQEPGLPPIITAHIGVPAAAVSGVTVGQGLAIPTAFLSPQGPVRPGQRDARFYRFFNRNTVFGYSTGTVEPTALPSFLTTPPTLWGALTQRVEGWRTTLAAQTQGRGQGTVAALLTGNTAFIPPALTQAYRVTGLTHLLAISGMQLTLVGVGLFWLVRWAAAWVPAIALRVPVTYPAALLGLIGAGGYALLAGGGVSVVRALAMVATVLLAILFKRRTNGLRAWGLAVGILVIINPTFVMQAGFQLSAVAVFGLLCYGILHPPAPVYERQPPRLTRLFTLLTTTVNATLVAGAVTAPIVFWQFGQLAPFSLVANLVAIPLMVGATYMGFLALVLWPLGLQSIALWPMEALCTLTNLWATSWAAVSPTTLPWLPITGGLFAALSGAIVLASISIGAGVALKRAWLTLAGITLTLALGFATPHLTPWPTHMLWNGDAILWALDTAPQPVSMAHPIPTSEVSTGTSPSVFSSQTTPFPSAKTSTGYRLMYDETQKDAGIEAQRAQLPVLGATTGAPASGVVSLGPQTPSSPYAWALQTNGTWFFKALPCTRPWQTTDPRCR